MTIEGYMGALMKNGFADYKPAFTKAYNCETAYDYITQSLKSQKSYDLAIIDQGLPGYTDQKINSGSDLVLLVKSKMPDCKIIMITAHTEVLVIYEIFKIVKPDGLFIKNDIDPDNLGQMVTEVMEGNLYQSHMVKNCIQDIWKKDLMVDDFNRQILFYLSKGFMAKDLDGVVQLSKGAINKRIIKMKSAFNVTNDNGLIKEVIKQGFI